MTEKQLEQCIKLAPIIDEVLEIYAGKPVTPMFIMDQIVKNIEGIKSTYITCAMWLYIGGITYELLQERNLRIFNIEEIN